MCHIPVLICMVAGYSLAFQLAECFTEREPVPALLITMFTASAATVAVVFINYLFGDES